MMEGFQKHVLPPYHYCMAHLFYFILFFFFIVILFFLFNNYLVSMCVLIAMIIINSKYSARFIISIINHLFSRVNIIS